MKVYNHHLITYVRTPQIMNAIINIEPVRISFFSSLPEFKSYGNKKTGSKQTCF